MINNSGVANKAIGVAVIGNKCRHVLSSIFDRSIPLVRLFKYGDSSTKQPGLKFEKKCSSLYSLKAKWE